MTLGRQVKASMTRIASVFALLLTVLFCPASTRAQSRYTQIFNRVPTTSVPSVYAFTPAFLNEQVTVAIANYDTVNTATFSVAQFQCSPDANDQNLTGITVTPLATFNSNLNAYGTGATIAASSVQFFTASGNGCMVFGFKFGTVTGTSSSLSAFLVQLPAIGLTNIFTTTAIPAGLLVQCGTGTAACDVQGGVVEGGNIATTPENPVRIGGVDSAAPNLIRSVGVDSNGTLVVGKTTSSPATGGSVSILVNNPNRSNAPLWTTGFSTFTNVTTATCTSLSASILQRVVIGTFPTAASTLTLWDNNSACSGTVIATITGAASAPAIGNIEFDVKLSSGLSAQWSVCTTSCSATLSTNN